MYSFNTWPESKILITWNSTKTPVLENKPVKISTEGDHALHQKVKNYISTYHCEEALKSNQTDATLTVNGSMLGTQHLARL